MSTDHYRGDGMEELYRLKTAALLHDPPDKTFAIKGHERRAEDLAERIFGAEASKLIGEERVKLADRVASSFDRWILSILMGEKYIHDLFRCEKVKIKNIVEPTLEKEITPEIKECDYNEFVNGLEKILNSTSDWKLKYHLLYLFYEPLWIFRGLPWGPADTRVPTHSVFDHNYATAAMINWTFRGEGRVKGLLVGLDIAGVQDFISSSRKARDMWISSYIVSALMWYLVAELVEELGPDVVIMPSMRMNPFYLYWLKSRLESKAQEGGVANQLNQLERLFYLSDKVYSMFKDLGMPPYPVIPGRATLALPPLDVIGRSALKMGSEDELKEYFIERLRKGWKLLWEATRKLAEIRAGEEGDITWSFILRVFEYYSKLNLRFDEVPPLKLRVEVVEIDESADRADLWSIYDEKYLELTSKTSLSKYSRVEPETELNLYEITKRAFNEEPLGFPKPSDRGFDYCTSCGKLPAIVVLPAGESEERPEEDEYGFFIYCTLVHNEDPLKCSKLLRSKNEEFRRLMENYKKWLENAGGKEASALRALKVLFSPGEKLCPWCFLKRTLSLEPRILKILLVGTENSVDVDAISKDLAQTYAETITWFPSLSHIASIRLYEKVAQLDSDGIKKLKHVLQGKKVSKPSQKRVTWVWYFMRKIYIERKARNPDLDEEEAFVQDLVLNNPEYMWFDPDARRDWDRILRKLSLSKWCWRYYALIRADGDSIGDLLEGKLTAFIPGVICKDNYEKLLLDEHVDEDELDVLKECLGRYIKCSGEGRFRDFMGSLVSGILNEEELERIKNEWSMEIAKKGIDQESAPKRIEGAAEVLRDVLDRRLRIVVSPSYHVAISAALMRAALLDVAIVAGLDGVVIYAGGDDLLALVPVDKSLDIVYNTRRAYGGYSVDVSLTLAANAELEDGVLSLGGGFLKIGNSSLPMLPSVGRSYTIYIAHYHYPLSAVIDSSLKLLEDVKERTGFIYFDDVYEERFLTSMKDMAVIIYNPRAAKEEYTILPLSWYRPIVPLNVQCRVEDHKGDIAYSVKATKELLRLIDERIDAERAGSKLPKISQSLLYDIEDAGFIEFLKRSINLVRESADRFSTVSELIEKLLEKLVKKNISAESQNEAERVYEYVLAEFRKSLPSFVGYYTLVEEKCTERKRSEKATVWTPAVSNIIHAAKLVKSGMR